jgi:drug/metabolite transporter (DMT)-like permease
MPLPTTSVADRHRTGIALCAASACGFGLMAIFATRAYAAGLGVTTVLALRFALAATVFWVIVGARRMRLRSGGATRAPAPTTSATSPPMARDRAPHRSAFTASAPSSERASRRAAMTALALGAGYSAQSGFFFSALRHIDVGLASLLLYTFPAIVCVASVALGRERLGAWKASALGLASAGTALVLLGGASGALQATGVLLGLGAGVTYSVYILVADGVVGRIDAWLFSALVTTGGAVAVTLAGVVTGSLALPSATGWLWIAAIALVSTVLPISTFLLGLERVGAPTASIVSTVEPVLTVSLAVLLLGETLGPTQLLGGLLVIAAVLALKSRRADRADAPAGFERAPLARGTVAPATDAA